MRDRKSLALILFLAAIALLVWEHRRLGGQVSFSSYSTNPNSPSEKIRKVLNREMKAADLQIEIQKAKIQQQAVELRQQLASPGDLPRSSYQGLRLQQESPERAVAEDNRKLDLDSDYRVKDVDQELRTQISQRQAVQHYDRVQAEAYIKAFLQNARDSGFEVTLDNNLDVVSIDPVSDFKPLRLPNSASPVQGRGGK